MSLEPENPAAPERVPVPGGFLERQPGEAPEVFGKRADAVRLEHAELKKRVDMEYRMTWRDHMERCYSVPLGHRPPPRGANGKVPRFESYEGCAKRGGVCDCYGRPCAVDRSDAERAPLGQ